MTGPEQSRGATVHYMTVAHLRDIVFTDKAPGVSFGWPVLRVIVDVRPAEVHEFRYHPLLQGYAYGGDITRGCRPGEYNLLTWAMLFDTINNHTTHNLFWTTVDL